MRYRMQQKLLSLGQDFTIQDQEGNDVYFVDGRALSFGAKYSFQDMHGQELAFIAQKVLSFRKRYRIFRQDQLAAEVSRGFSWFRKRLTIDVPGPDDYGVVGRVFGREYQFTRGGIQVAKVSRAFFTFKDSYGIEIADDEDQVLILATAVVIDHICDSDESRSSFG